MSLSRKYRAGVIGIGHQATQDHIPAIQESSRASLVALCDLNFSVLEPYNDEGITVYKDYQLMLDKEELDFVVVATPHDTHAPIVEAAARKGVNVLKEKPFARNLKEAVRLKNVCEKGGIQLMTTLQRRFNPVYTTVSRQLEQVGSPYFLEIKYGMFIQRPGHGWRGDLRRAGGGCIIDLGYHMIDVLIWLFGLPDRVISLASAIASTDDDYNAEDTATVLFQYLKGPFGSLSLSRRYSPKVEHFNIYGSSGSLSVEQRKMERTRSDGQIVERLELDKFGPVEALRQLDYFCDVLDGKEENFGAPISHLQHISLVEACYVSQQENRYINPKELLSHATSGD